MSAGIICPAAVSIRTNEALRENFNYHDSLGSPKLKRNESHMEKKPIIVRRPFKYVKHQGPRPVGAASISTFKFHDARCDANGLDSVRALSIRRAPNAASHERSSAHGSKFGRQQTGVDDLAHGSRKNERPYEPPVSRLLSSRKLNLSALDISACQKKKTPQVEVARDELTNLPFHTDSNLAQSPGTARLWEWFSQGRTSCFSDWSNSAPTSSRRSLTICETPTQLYLPKSSKEIAQKKRISSDPRLPLSRTCDSKPFHNTRSRSDFGLTTFS
ncbi:hypothetical protein PGTUg99_019468 [Puccinia graminis f. sp. tritici]|uniref:Uncharacterized protein n=1 Tax=Puccinia graminis f. sp. tritici TaxID=56615 RepID=A0A5B0R798_PUCGR|nr:hypothetical protein PGTUg99_019468 [Puccinia graminis f. sp. tritici]